MRTLTTVIHPAHVTNLLTVLAVASLALFFAAGLVVTITDSDIALVVSIYGILNALLCTFGACAIHDVRDSFASRK